MNKLIFLLLLLAGCSLTAQYNGRNRVLDHSMDRQPIPTDKKSEKPDLVGITVERLTTELTLDTFQQAVIRQLLEDNTEREQQIISQDIPDESKREQVLALRGKLDEKIGEVLNEEQKARLQALKDRKKKK